MGSDWDQSLRDQATPFVPGLPEAQEDPPQRIEARADQERGQRQHKTEG